MTLLPAARYRNPFTLMELTVVIGILALAAGFAVASIRHNSPVMMLRQAALQFESFCSRVRFQALEDGQEKAVLFHPETRTFHLRKAETEQTDYPDRMELQWTIPEGFSLSEEGLEDELDENGDLLMFRFFPNGSAAGKRVFQLQYASLRIRFELSMLTGRFLRSEAEDLP